jgi:hypothetical protein
MITTVELVAMHSLSIDACLLLDDGMHVGDAVTATLSLQTTHVCESKAHDSLMMPSWAKATNASNRIPSGLTSLGVSERAQVIT